MRYFFLFIVFFASFSVSAATYTPSVQTIIAKGKLVVAMNENDSAPLFSVDKAGNFSGFDVELAEYIGKNLGVRVEYLRTAKTFDEVVDLVSAGKADIAISLLTPNLPRAKKAFFTVPYLYLSQTLLYNRIVAAQHQWSDPVNQIRDAKNLKIGILQGSSYIHYAKNYFPYATLVLYPTLASAIIAIEKKEIFGFFGNSASVLYWLKQNADASLYVGASNLKNKIDPIAIAVSPKYPDLVNWLNLALGLRQHEMQESKFAKQYASTIGPRQ